MISFALSIIVLIVAYFTYGKFVEKVFGVEKERTTPAIKLRDDVDFMPLPAWRIFLIQFLNIAGLEPIFGAIAGAMFGPVDGGFTKYIRGNPKLKAASKYGADGNGGVDLLK